VNTAPILSGVSPGTDTNLPGRYRRLRLMPRGPGARFRVWGDGHISTLLHLFLRWSYTARVGALRPIVRLIISVCVMLTVGRSPVLCDRGRSSCTVSSVEAPSGWV